MAEPISLTITPLLHDTDGEMLAVPEGVDFHLHGRGISLLINLQNGGRFTYSLLDGVDDRAGTVEAKPR